VLTYFSAPCPGPSGEGVGERGRGVGQRGSEKVNGMRVTVAVWDMNKEMEKIGGRESRKHGMTKLMERADPVGYIG